MLEPFFFKQPIDKTDTLTHMTTHILDLVKGRGYISFRKDHKIAIELFISNYIFF